MPDDETLLREVLGREADRLCHGVATPATPPWLDGHARQPRPQRWAPLAAAAAVVLATGTGVGVGLLRDDSGRSPERVVAGPPATTPDAGEPSPLAKASTGPAESAPSPTAMARTGAVAAYWVGGPAGRRALYREFRTGPVGVAEAVEAMLAGRPADPDLTSVWRPAAVLSASVTGPKGDSVVDLDLSSDAFVATGVDAESARLAVQQLAYTATAASPGSTSVRLKVDGKAGYRAWDRLTLPASVRRDPAVRASIWILDPQHGDVRTPGTVVVKGSGHAFEGTIRWELQRVGSSKPLKAGFVTTRGDGIPGDFTVSLRLSAGSYRFVAFEEDMSGGESGFGPRLNVDSKDFTVR